VNQNRQFNAENLPPNAVEHQPALVLPKNPAELGATEVFGLKGGSIMMRKALACTMLLGVACSLPAAADDGGSSWLKFKGGIGVDPISTVTGCPGTPTAPLPCATDPNDTLSPPSSASPTVSFNIVRGVHPPGQIWVINDLDAKVQSGGSITINGKGLILGGGNNGGRPAPGVSVIATLICDLPTTSIPVPPQFSTASAGVLLSPTGDFQINGTLSPLPPAACTSPMLLIRNAATATGGFPNPWFAIGIYRPPGSDKGGDH
jgi:hypothetical protein